MPSSEKLKAMWKPSGTICGHQDTREIAVGQVMKMRQQRLKHGCGRFSRGDHANMLQLAKINNVFTDVETTPTRWVSLHLYLFRKSSLNAACRQRLRKDSTCDLSQIQ
jgi:hypothetical protein